jgi:hypothetical protein
VSDKKNGEKSKNCIDCIFLKWRKDIGIVWCKFKLLPKNAYNYPPPNGEPYKDFEQIDCKIYST